MEPITEAEPDRETSADMSEENADGGRANIREVFRHRKKLSARKRDRKQRLNRQLRMTMTPRTALMNLNEVEGLQMSEFTVKRDRNDDFVAYVTINSLEYVGRGFSRISAMNAACEKAWRDYILALMTPKKKTALDGTLEQTDATNGESDAQDSDAPNDHLPMVNLASYAIYKLFGEWESEGFEVPSMNATNPASRLRSELPPNWENIHVCSLLSMMRPDTSYEDSGTSGKEPNIMQRLSVIVDDMKFIACGRSKKIARYNVAVAVCNILFDTNFEADLCEDLECCTVLAI